MNNLRGAYAALRQAAQTAGANNFRETKRHIEDSLQPYLRNTYRARCTGWVGNLLNLQRTGEIVADGGSYAWLQTYTAGPNQAGGPAVGDDMLVWETSPGNPVVVGRMQKQGSVPGSTVLTYGDALLDSTFTGLGFSSSGLTGTIGTGLAYIDGTRRLLAAATNVSLAASSDNYIDWDGTKFTVTSVTSGSAAPGVALNSMRLWMATTSTTAVTATTDLRNSGVRISGNLSATGSCTVSGSISAAGAITSNGALTGASLTSNGPAVVNPASGFSGKILDAQVAGVSKWSVDQNGHAKGGFQFNGGTNNRALSTTALAAGLYGPYAAGAPAGAIGAYALVQAANNPSGTTIGFYTTSGSDPGVATFYSIASGSTYCGNYTVIPLNANGQFSFHNYNTTDLIIDIYGYVY